MGDPIMSRLGGEPSAEQAAEIVPLVRRLKEMRQVDHLAIGSSRYEIQADIGNVTVRIHLRDTRTRLRDAVDMSLELSAWKTKLLNRKHPDLLLDASVIPILRARGVTAAEMEEALALIRRRPRIAMQHKGAGIATGDVWVRGIRLYREGGIVIAQCREEDLMVAGRSVAITRRLEIPHTMLSAMTGRPVSDLVASPLLAQSRSTINKMWMNGKGKGQRVAFLMNAAPMTDRDAMLDLAA